MASSRTPAVGIIANPAAGKDIRRLVAQGRFVTNQEKVNILRRVLAGIESVGIRRVVFMPDMNGLGHGSMDGRSGSLDVEFVDILVTNKEIDSTRAAEAMQDLRVWDALSPWEVTGRIAPLPRARATSQSFPYPRAPTTSSPR